MENINKRIESQEKILQPICIIQETLYNEDYLEC